MCIYVKKAQTGATIVAVFGSPAAEVDNSPCLHLLVPFFTPSDITNSAFRKHHWVSGLVRVGSPETYTDVFPSPVLWITPTKFSFLFLRGNCHIEFYLHCTKVLVFHPLCAQLLVPCDALEGHTCFTVL